MHNREKKQANNENQKKTKRPVMILKSTAVEIFHIFKSEHEFVNMLSICLNIAGLKSQAESERNKQCVAHKVYTTFDIFP